MAVCHMCRWVSIMPGMTMPPVASISAVPSGTCRFGPTAAIRSSVTSTSASARIRCPSSMVSTVALRKTSGRPATRSAAVVIETSTIGAERAITRPLADECP